MPRRLPLPSIDPEPDARSLRWGWALWAAGLAALIAFVRMGGLPSTRAPFLALAGALLLLWPAWRGGRLLWHTLRDSAHAEWNGAYYEFDGRQIRVIDDEAGALWFGVSDVLDALGLTGHARDPARLRLIAGRDGVVRLARHRLLCFSERGLRAWLERRTEPRAAAFARWLETQVLRPHRRRREIAGGTEPAQGRSG